MLFNFSDPYSVPVDGPYWYARNSNIFIATEAIFTNSGENAKEDPNQNTDENSCENAK